MAKLSSAARNKLPKGDFGMPGQKKYPMPDAAHAANAEARATQQVNKGNLSSGARAQIVAKAKKVLAKSSGKNTGGFDHHESMAPHLDPNKRC